MRYYRLERLHTAKGNRTTIEMLSLNKRLKLLGLMIWYVSLIRLKAVMV